MTSKGKNEIIMLAALLAVAAFLWLPRLQSAKKAAAPMAVNRLFAQTQKAASEAPVGIASLQDLAGNVRYTGMKDRDPLDNSSIMAKEEVIVQQAPEASMPALSISAVVWGTNRPQAIINNKVVHIGETIDGVKVINIGKEGVTIDFNGRKTVMPIK
jgi:hypothetical protein